MKNYKDGDIIYLDNYDLKLLEEVLDKYDDMVDELEIIFDTYINNNITKEGNDLFTKFLVEANKVMVMMDFWDIMDKKYEITGYNSTLGEDNMTIIVKTKTIEEMMGKYIN